MKLFASLETTGSKQETTLDDAASNLLVVASKATPKGSATISVLSFNRFDGAATRPE